MRERSEKEIVKTTAELFGNLAGISDFVQATYSSDYTDKEVEELEVLWHNANREVDKINEKFQEVYFRNVDEGVDLILRNESEKSKKIVLMDKKIVV